MSRLLGHLPFYFAADNTIVEQLKLKVMAGLFLMFIMTIALGEMLGGFFYAQEDTNSKLFIKKVMTKALFSEKLSIFAKE